MRTLHGKVVLVTGAARGIGEHTARLAAARGARVALVGLEPERLGRLADELEASAPARLPPGASGPVHAWAAADVTDSTALTAAVDTVVDRLGCLDVVVANAGIAGRGTVATADVEALARTIDVNLTGVLRTVHATLPSIVARRGHYLLVASASSFLAMPGMAAYAAAKAGVEHFATALRLEVDATGVTVGTAHPIWIDTDMVRDAKDDLPSFRTALQSLPGPLGRTLPVGDCARALVDGIERRRRRVYVPRSMAAFQALRTVLNGPLGHRLLLRPGAGVDVATMEAEVRALGRSYGRTCAVAPSPAATRSDAPPAA
jgi:NAD(P)-dependent dehydrogenase (short-subunit alcohol dehydrogenase family)